jgi:hypothetical protein
MELVDMKKPKEETKVAEQPSEPMTDGAKDLYPCGLEGSICEDEIEKLGIDISKIEVGEKVIIHAVGEITEVWQEKIQRDGEEEIRNHLRWQIQKLALKFPNDFNDSFEEAAKKKDE